MFNSAKIGEARRGKGLERSELAELLGVSTRAVYFWEAGTRMPRAKHMRKIALATGKPLEYFLEDVA